MPANDPQWCIEIGILASSNVFKKMEVPMSSLIELGTSSTITRGKAAAQLQRLAAHPKRHGDVEFRRDGRHYVLAVELRLGADGNKLEREIS